MKENGKNTKIENLPNGQEKYGGKKFAYMHIWGKNWKVLYFLQILVWNCFERLFALDKFRTWISLHLPKEELNALGKIQFTIGTNFWNTVPQYIYINNNGPTTLSKRLNGMVFQDCAWGSKRRFTHPTFKDLSIISKSGMLSPPSFILPIIVERLILGGLWFHIKLDRNLFTWSTKPAGTLRTEEMKIIIERAKLLRL